MLLGVRRDASGFEIKRAYEAARRDYARDNFPPEVRTELSDEIEAINEIIDEAYQILRDDGLRVSYLTNLRE
jgi:DnaJ-class molecular chaperone